ncbi:DUF3857 domain-containing protein [Parabacteroides sp. OttesenSCG-928-N08]|nr:DUF3857 domain-containing protein [Parabacteroides sp. OttesenSCG-928-N08]
MNRLLLLFALFFVALSTSYAQEYSFKYGKITNDELTMTSYEKDTSAVAVTIHDEAYLYYDYNVSNGFQVVMETSKKIKILKQEGIEKADIAIPYYRSGANREQISSLEAIAYNMENGKMTKSKLEKKYIFDEELNSNYKQMKFSIPNVKVGTVIEYKYKLTSPFTYSIPEWYVQGDIPVINSYYEVLIPEYYIFNIDAAKGLYIVNVEETTKSQELTLGYHDGQRQRTTSNSRLYKITAQDVPALKSEPFLWCVDDLRTSIRFEINGTRFPYENYKSYTNTWESLERTLMDETDFGKNLKMSNPFKEEIKIIAASSLPEKERIETIYSLVKNKIRWDESYAFYGNNAKDAVKNGTGNNAQINMILLSALKDASIRAYPILISRRNIGRLPYAHPSLNKLNTFLVAAETSEGECYYMDGSAVYGGLNMLPVNLLVDRGRILNDGGDEKWVDLTNISKNNEIVKQTCTLDEEGLLHCEKETRYLFQPALQFKTNYYAHKDSVDYIEKYQTNHNLTIEEYSVTGAEPLSNTVIEKVTFSKQIDLVGDFIYLNPLIFPHIENNPFTQSERLLPIEFNYPISTIINTELTIPDGYQIEELPQPLNMSLENNEGRLLYNVTQKDEKTILVNYRFMMNQVIFLAESYQFIREFYAQTATKNNEMIVLKKR